MEDPASIGASSAFAGSRVVARPSRRQEKRLIMVNLRRFRKEKDIANYSGRTKDRNPLGPFIQQIDRLVSVSSYKST
jgi:hypothetical protein